MSQTSELTKAGSTQSATDVHRSNGVCVTIKAKEGNAGAVIEAHGATVSGCVRVCAIMQSSDDDHLIAAHAFDGDNRVTHIKISNRFGSKVLTLDRWLDLLCPDGLDYLVSPEEMSGIIDREIGEVN